MRSSQVRDSLPDAVSNLLECYEYGVEGVKLKKSDIKEHKKLAAKLKIQMKDAQDGKRSRSFYAAALRVLGSCYENSVGLEKNIDKTIQLYECAAKHGNKTAQLNLGYFHFKGRHIPKNYKKAFKFLKQAASEEESKGNPFAQYQLGICYQYGQGTQKNHDKAIECFELAAKQGESRAQASLGYFFEHVKGGEENIKRAIKYYESSAQQGNKVGLNALGLCYKHGKGELKQDYNKAFELFRQAAEEKSFAGAFVNLGNCYRFAEGVKKNLGEAYKCYQKAGSSQKKALTHIKKLKQTFKDYLPKLDFKNNTEEAMQMYYLGAEMGRSDFQYHLGRCYELGQGVEQNWDEAFKYYERAAKQGHVKSMIHQGYCHKYGKGTAINVNLGIHYYKSAAEQGDPEAENLLAFSYVQGLVPGKGVKDAVLLYQKAADKGYAKAQYNLAMCYEMKHGIGLDLTEEERREKYMSLYELAAEQGAKKAKERLAKEVYKNMDIISSSSSSFFNQSPSKVKRKSEPLKESKEEPRKEMRLSVT